MEVNMKYVVFILLILCTVCLFGNSDYSIKDTQYVLLKIESNPSIIYNGGTNSETMLETFGGTELKGDSVYPIISYYKAVLFLNKESLLKYLKLNKIENGFVIDVKGIKSVQQKEISKVIEKSVFDHFETELK